ncbi:hypothetical protein, partial [Paenibacillus polymyxa]|uniref:hypothetical protein n=1 Tax=Paenibacillus polymyxa TaxID=1406 RepID=UPI001E54BC0A
FYELYSLRTGPKTTASLLTKVSTDSVVFHSKGFELARFFESFTIEVTNSFIPSLSPFLTGAPKKFWAKIRLSAVYHLDPL